MSEDDLVVDVEQMMQSLDSDLLRELEVLHAQSSPSQADQAGPSSAAAAEPGSPEVAY